MAGVIFLSVFFVWAITREMFHAHRTDYLRTKAGREPSSGQKRTPMENLRALAILLTCAFLFAAAYTLAVHAFWRLRRETSLEKGGSVMRMRLLTSILVFCCASVCSATCQAQLAGYSAGDLDFSPAIQLIIVAAIFFCLNLGMTWVAHDARARQLDGIALWMLLAFVLGPIGILIYLISRPRGEMHPCPGCLNSRLVATLECPHCGIKC